MDFTGKSCIVTGATSGIGLAIARELAGTGADLIVTGRNAQKAAAAAETLRASGGRVQSVAADLSDPAAPVAICQAALDAYGRIDVLFNNAGILINGTVLDFSDEDWNKVLDLNVSAAFRMSRAVLPEMQARTAGSIVNVASDWALIGAKGAVAYCVSKAAIAQLTRCMALDHAADGIRVNAVCPGDTDTPMLAAGLQGVDRAKKVASLGAAIPMGRIARPEEVAKVAVFLASEDASFMTGALVPVDGGNSAQ